MDTMDGSEGSAGPTAAKPAVPPPPPQPAALAEKTCMGIGWVKFDRAWPSGKQALVEFQEVPSLRCVGVQTSRVLGASASGGAGGAGSLPAQSPVGGESAYADVGEETWALACAGQFSLLAPAFSASAAEGAGTGATGITSRAAGSASPWKVRCYGVALRLEAQAREANGMESRSSRASAADPAAREAPVRPVASSNGDEGDEHAITLPSLRDTAEAMAKGMEAVAGRAGSIVFSVKSASWDPGPRRLASSTATAAGRICRQAAKIAQRSAEQVGRLATLPFSGGGSGGAAGDAGSTGSRPGGG